MARPVVEEPRETRRVLGELGRSGRGPTLLCVGGLHGNEPAGIHGAQRVLEKLGDREAELLGRFVALAGNLGALRAGRRYLARDLNRAWIPERVERLRNGTGAEGGAMESPEDREQRELLAAMDEALADARGPVYVLDLHTTSGTGGPFATVADTLPNRTFALNIPVPLILGLEELVDGTLLEYMGARGYVAALFEAGQHAEARAVDRAEAAVWIAVAATGLLPEARVPELAAARKLLRRDTERLPRVLEMRYRHPVGEGDGFTMKPGYKNFQAVERGEVVARSVKGEVAAPESARILMPLYQSQGHDGFFIVREFRPVWLHVSRILRRLRIARWVHWLPGIRRHPELEHALVVDRRIARWYALQILHLLGFRKHLERGNTLVVLRRRYDVAE